MESSDKNKESPTGSRQEAKADLALEKKEEDPEKNTITKEEDEDIEDNWDRNTRLPPGMMKRWFGGGPETDAEIKSLFSQLLIDIGHRKLKHLEYDPQGKLATIILCD